MTIVVGYDLALPAQQTYATLQVSLNNWLNRSDLTSMVPDFIALAEERMNRALRVRQMEQALPETEIGGDNGIAVPATTAAFKTVWATANETRPLHAQTFSYVKSRGRVGVPTCYAWQGDRLYFDGTGTVAGVLYRRIPSLSAENTVNWLLTEAPSAYLFGAMREAFDFLRDDIERDRWGARFEKVLDELSGINVRDLYGAPLQTRVG